MLVRRAPRTLSSCIAPAPPRPSANGAAPAPREPLTAREREVVRHVVDGGTNPQIAATLVLSDRTVQSHVAEARRKLGARNRTHLAVLALRLGLVEMPEADRE